MKNIQNIFLLKSGFSFQISVTEVFCFYEYDKVTDAPNRNEINSDHVPNLNILLIPYKILF